MFYKHPDRKHKLFSLDGSHNGTRYFETDANHGLFCRPEKVQRLSLNGASQPISPFNAVRLSTIGKLISNCALKDRSHS